MLIRGSTKNITIRGAINAFNSCITTVLIKLCPNKPIIDEITKIILGIRMGRNILVAFSFLTIYLYQKYPAIQEAGNI